MRVLIAAALVLLGMTGSALAWGNTGHMIVCEIAFKLVAPDTRAAIQRLIKSDNNPKFNTFSKACTAPDNPHTRPDEHFINLPRDAAGVTSNDSCPQAAKCLLTAIKNDQAVVASRSARPKDRLIALRFLGHWAGDIHQPLHVSFADDRGGNDIMVSGKCSGKLHSAWDNCMVADAVGSDVAAAAAKLSKAITPEMKAKWEASDQPKDWANESFALAEAAGTKYCTLQQPHTCQQPSPKSVKIDAAYLQTNEPVVKQRLQQAGVRLARMLDRTFGN
ncbi:MAG: nuclease [Bradyrhizobium sp.]|nr:nuclease [Bradyrhizobium sp.]